MMRQRECLVNGLNKQWTKYIEQSLINKVVSKGEQNSRLTYEVLSYPVTHITIAYLYKSIHTNFIWMAMYVA